MKVFLQLEPHKRHSLLLLFGVGLTFWSSLASLLPTLPLYVESLGGTAQQIGLVMGAFSIGLLLFRSRLGNMSDRRGRKLVLIVGTAAAAIAPFGYLYATSMPALIFIRAFHGISIAAFTTAYSALVTDLSPPAHRGELIGYMSLVQPVGVALGPAIGGFVQEAYGYPPLFIVSGILGSVALLSTLQIDDPPREGSDRPTPSSSAKRSSWQLLGSPRLRVPSLVMLFVGLVFGTLSTFVPLLIKATEAALNPGWFYTAIALVSFSVRLVSGRASDRIGRGLFITISLCCYCAAMLTISQATTAPTFLLGAVLEGAAAGTMIPMMVALMADRSTAEERGIVFALCIGGFDLGIALAGPLLGAIAPTVGYPGLFRIATGFACLALVIFTTQNSKDLNHSLRFATGKGKDIYAISMKTG